MRAGVTTLRARGELLRTLEAFAVAGQTALIFGPVGVGKTAIMNELGRRARASGRPCGTSRRVEALGDVTRALAEAYPEAATLGLAARLLRGRLRLAVERAPGVLLLDGVVEASRPVKGFLRSLRGMGLGVVIAVDVERPRDRDRARGFGLSYREIEVPPLHGVALRKILAEELSHLDLPRELAETERLALVHAADGLPGKLLAMLRRLPLPGYWHGGDLRLSLLQTDAGVELVETLLRLDVPASTAYRMKTKAVESAETAARAPVRPMTPTAAGSRRGTSPPAPRKG